MINGGTEDEAQGGAVATDETAAGGEPDGKTEDDDKPEDKTTDSASVYQINEGSGAQNSSGNEGAVQNWRVYEMSESAIALADIKQEPNPLVIPTVTIAIVLFFSGVVMKTFYYIKQV